MPHSNVPQFVEIEDKIFGPFTLRQFLVLLAGGIFIMLFWFIFSFGIIFWILAVPTALLSLFISIGQMNGRPVLANVLPFLTYFTGPKRMFFQKGSDEIIQTRAAPKPVAQNLPQAEVRSRLKRLAYVLDQKVAQEGETLGDTNTTN